MATTANHTPLLIFLAFMGYSVYRRIRRNFGRVALRPTAMAGRITLFVVITMVILFAALFMDGAVLAALLGGLVAGGVVGIVGLRLTQIEVTPAGAFYLPNKYLGTGISLLFVGRLAYRFVVLGMTDEALSQPPTVGQNAVTFFMFGVLACYYIVYFFGLMIRNRKLTLAAKIPPPLPPPPPAMAAAAAIPPPPLPAAENKTTL